ncbi:hypothetical protein RSSM_01251 [Rhodopirellula sallentina SM41]|uniref:Uncharacterized protein n=1 Tax=Rhodopirellula sallentina SM41 TaxID=1263870 RepID=M5U7J1_9BACT|nr:hypothetical protein RSSM_01251 [Rhodopirellula sallentina SM41]
MNKGWGLDLGAGADSFEWPPKANRLEGVGTPPQRSALHFATRVFSRRVISRLKN